MTFNSNKIKIFDIRLHASRQSFRTLDCSRNNVDGDSVSQVLEVTLCNGTRSLRWWVLLLPLGKGESESDIRAHLYKRKEDAFCTSFNKRDLSFCIAYKSLIHT